VIRHQGYRFRLKPSASEETLLRQFLGCTRFAWNAILAENAFRHEQGDPLALNYAAFCARLTLLKSRHTFLRDAHSQTLQQTLRDLASSYRRAFDPKLAAGLPRFKRKGDVQGIRFPQGFKVERKGVFLPKIGWVGFCVSKRTAKRKVEGEVKNVTVRLESGQWHVSIQTEREVLEPIHEMMGEVVGVDVGVARFAALADGTFFDGANAFQMHAARLAIAQRKIARKVRFSANWRKAKARVMKIQVKIANVRRDQIHKASTTISKNHAIVVMEDLRITNMTASAKGTVEAPGVNVAAKSALNRRILDQSWGELRRQIGYKLAWAGGKLLLVAPRNTSRECSHCHHVSKENRLSRSAFVCVACGHTAHADTNAAKNIEGRAGWARIACGDLSMDESMKQETRRVA
jgi:putative transposase